MEGYIKIYGKTRRSLYEGWQKVVCFVSYSNPHDYRKIVEDSFQYHLSLDLDYIKQNHPDHFTEPHNVGRAILLYYYFRDRHQFFNDNHFEYIGPNALPSREPDEEGENYKLWVNDIA
jgi:hypothetical protein